MNDNTNINLERVCRSLTELGYGFSMQHVGGNIVYPILTTVNFGYLTITNEDNYSLIHSTPVFDGDEIVNEDDRVLASGIKDDWTIIALAGGYARWMVREDEEACKLADWMNEQRAAYRAGELTPEQIKKMESLPEWSW